MRFLKLDKNILFSSVWIDRDVRDVFVTALLMAHPHELRHEEAQLGVRDIKPTGFVVPPGSYGFIPAAGMVSSIKLWLREIPASMLLRNWEAPITRADRRSSKVAALCASITASSC
jgi:hypothetical protein